MSAVPSSWYTAVPLKSERSLDEGSCEVMKLETEEERPSWYEMTTWGAVTGSNGQ